MYKDDTGKHAVQWYGQENQEMQAMEEMGELITALSHKRRGRIDNESVCEEIADVLLALESLKFSFGEDKVNEYLAMKKQRLMIRIGVEMAAKTERERGNTE
jgi:hypothetical protein